jgi:flagellar hook-length control protein FliK
MDGLGLVAPAATIVNAGSNATDAPAADTGAAPTNTDFAALLAGLLPQLPDPAIAPSSTPTEESTETAPTADATALPLQAAAILPGAHPASHTATARSAYEQAVAATPVDTEQPSAGAVPAAKAQLPAAAEPASVAAPAAAAILAADATTAAPAASHTQESIAAPSIEAPAAAAETLPAHALLQAPPEKGPSPQPLAVLDVKAPFDTPEFAPQLSQQVVWMADKDAQIAELRINPPELGPVEVRLQLSGDEATVQFVSAHADVRNALEAAIVRLRDSLAQAGIQLGEASVGAESFREQSHSNGGRDERGARARDGDNAWNASASGARMQRGLIDLFA